MIFVQDAHHVEDYRLMITFSNGLQKAVDLSDIFEGPMFEPLRDPVLFRQFKVDPESETIVWENGADLAPEYLYQKGQEVENRQNA